MVIITDAQGNIQSPTIPENIYQGSNLANEIIFLSPLPQNNQCAIKFRLANGLVTEQYFMTPYTSVPSQYGLNAWVFGIPLAVTQYYGQVTFQIKMFAGGQQIVATCAGTFPVLRGVVPLPNEVPSTSTFDEILEYLQTLTNGSIVSKGLWPYDSTYNYPFGASVFDESTRTIYTSLIDENLGNSLTDTTYWGATYISGLTTADVQGLIDGSMQDFTNELTALQNGKLDKASVLNIRSNSQTETYSADFVNSNFAPLAFTSNLYATKETDSVATLNTEKPTLDVANVLTSTTSNTSFDWNTPSFSLIRTLENAVTLNNENSFTADIYFMLDKNTGMSWGAIISVSTDNGTTWQEISTQQSFGENEYNADTLTYESLQVFTNGLLGVEEYPIGTLLKIDLFTKFDASHTVTNTVYCGVEIDNASVYSYVQFNFTNIQIDTNQISDGAVTYDKLANDVKTKFGQVEIIEVQGTVEAVSDMPYQYLITFTLPNDFDLTSVKEYLFKLTTNISLVNLTNIRIFVQKGLQTINILTPYNNGVSYANENDLAQVFNNSNGWEFKGIIQSTGLLVEMDNLASINEVIGDVDTLLTTLNSGGGV